MALLNDIKVLLRISNSPYDSEISDLIAACRKDLLIAGVLSTKTVDDTDPLIKRAVSIYVKAHFGWDNPDKEGLLQSYNSLKSHLSQSSEYIGTVV